MLVSRSQSFGNGEHSVSRFDHRPRAACVGPVSDRARLPRHELEVALPVGSTTGSGNGARSRTPRQDFADRVRGLRDRRQVHGGGAVPPGVRRLRRGKPVALIRAGAGPAGRRRPRVRGAAGRHRRLGRRLHHHAGRRNRGCMHRIFLERQAHRRALLRGVVPRCAGARPWNRAHARVRSTPCRRSRPSKTASRASPGRHSGSRATTRSEPISGGWLSTWAGIPYSWSPRTRPSTTCRAS